MSIAMRILLFFRKIVGNLLEKQIQELPKYGEPCEHDNPVFVDYVDYDNLVEDWYLVWICVKCGGYRTERHAKHHYANLKWKVRE